MMMMIYDIDMFFCFTDERTIENLCMFKVELPFQKLHLFFRGLERDKRLYYLLIIDTHTQKVGVYFHGIQVFSKLVESP